MSSWRTENEALFPWYYVTSLLAFIRNCFRMPPHALVQKSGANGWSLRNFVSTAVSTSLPGMRRMEQKSENSGHFGAWLGKLHVHFILLVSIFFFNSRILARIFLSHSLQSKFLVFSYWELFIELSVNFLRPPVS